jgi:hypothetical protein
MPPFCVYHKDEFQSLTPQVTCYGDIEKRAGRSLYPENADNLIESDAPDYAGKKEIIK